MKNKKKYNILILSNIRNEENIEDKYIAKAFEKNGHNVTMLWVDYDEKLDNEFDVIIRRNTWVENKSETSYYKVKDNEFKERIKKKNVKTVNLEGLDGIGKQYLCDLFKANKKVIPTIDSLDQLNQLPNVEEYVLKEKSSFGSGIGQRIIKREEIERKFRNGDLIQPKLKFKSEVEFHFVGDKLMYVHEYTPSKYPDYPKPKLIIPNENEKELAYEFAKLSNLKIGFQRIDFLRLENDELILLEIEDNAPHMSLEILDNNLRKNVIDEYKKNIYDYLLN